MSSKREAIKERALVCVDEVYSESDAPFFPVEAFLDEAAVWVLRAVPTRLLGAGKELPVDELYASEDGSGSIPLPEDFLRLLRFRMEGWRRPVLATIADTDPRYVQQFNPTLRGGEAKPIVAICEDTRRLEYFSSSRGVRAQVAEARYFGFDKVDDHFPEKLIELTSWKLAEIVLTVMNDTQAMQLCAARVNEIMQVI